MKIRHDKPKFDPTFAKVNVILRWLYTNIPVDVRQSPVIRSGDIAFYKSK